MVRGSEIFRHTYRDIARKCIEAGEIEFFCGGGGEREGVIEYERRRRREKELSSSCFYTLSGNVSVRVSEDLGTAYQLFFTSLYCVPGYNSSHFLSKVQNSIMPLLIYHRMACGFSANELDYSCNKAVNGTRKRKCIKDDSGGFVVVTRQN